MKFQEMWELLAYNEVNKDFHEKYVNFTFQYAFPNMYNSHFTSLIIAQYLDMDKAYSYMKGFEDAMKLFYLLGLPEDLDEIKKTSEEVEEMFNKEIEEYNKKYKDNNNPFQGFNYLNN